MDIFDLREKKKAAGLTNQEIADLSGIPFSTINKNFSGATKNPRYSTALVFIASTILNHELKRLLDGILAMRESFSLRGL